jgi:predicted MPP superfamily phosphohydrolase
MFAASAVLLFAGHVLVWHIVSGWLKVEAYLSSPFFIIFVFLFLSIIISSYLIHQKDNLFTRTYYLISAVWTGLLVNFLLVFFGVFIISLLVPNFFVNQFSLPLAVIIITVVLSIYGVFKAFSSRVKNYEVKIKDLPEYWHGKEIVQISDVHLGPIYRKKFFYKTIDRINKLKPELVCVTGDLFDGMESDFTWLNHPFSRLETRHGVYYSFGNHDLYLGFNRVKKLLENSPVIILDNKMKIVEGLQIIGINYSFNKDFDLYQAILNQVGYSQKMPSLLLYHEPKNIDSAVKAGIDLQLSGHTHKGQMFPFNLIAKLAYKGYDAGLFNIGEFSLIINNGLGTWGPPMRTVGRGEISKIKLLPLN